MHENIAAETNIQQNSIDLLNHKNVGYTYLTPDECLQLRDSKLNEVILKDILISQLQKINGFEYKGNAYTFSPKNIAKAIEEQLTYPGQIRVTVVRESRASEVAH